MPADRHFIKITPVIGNGRRLAIGREASSDARRVGGYRLPGLRSALEYRIPQKALDEYLNGREAA